MTVVWASGWGGRPDARSSQVLLKTFLTEHLHTFRREDRLEEMGLPDRKEAVQNESGAKSMQSTGSSLRVGKWKIHCEGALTRS